MTSSEIRRKYLEFFKARGHEIIPSAPLVLAEDPTTLFTSSGMQPLIPYLLGEPHPSGSKRLVDSQPSLRLGDVEEVGDNRHTTFFEMLGNWSLGDYFKVEQLPWFLEFLTKELGLDKARLWVSVFEGDKSTGVPRDEESLAVWQKLGISKERIFFYDVKKNWWSRSGEPSLMPTGEIGGPDSEVFYEFTEVHHDPKFGQECHPNCDCGRFLEIGNSVFIQYQKQADGSLKELPQKNVDFGGGLERLSAAISNDPDIFLIDLFWPLIKSLEKLSGKSYGQDPETTRAMRIIADHLRAAIMIARDSILPSNKAQGYVLRRLLRRAFLFTKKLNFETGGDYFPGFISILADSYDDIFPDLKEKKVQIADAFQEEADRFDKVLKSGIKEIDKTSRIDAQTAFYLLESFGLPFEITEEIARERGQVIKKEDFQKEIEKHQVLSRQGAENLFRGGLADQSYEVTKLHTATHLLHEALRRVLGSHVRQEGSNITAERLRFDFRQPTKLTAEELKKTADLVNEQIAKQLEVTETVQDLSQALASGARAFFREKYPEKVKVYSIGDFSREICGGPHVASTKELGRFRIIKEEAVAQGIRRIKAILENGG
ncbi:MAG: alanine--tRNA ligase [Candidatus Nealsonbacteria bacterium]|nr:alanine--tRNA ligase [Candidatus Nealsonbacteria bacterium]